MAWPRAVLSQMARGAAAQVIGAWLDALLWCWIALQFAYWAFVYIGIRRFERAAARVGDPADAAAADRLSHSGL